MIDSQERAHLQHNDVFDAQPYGTGVGTLIP
jgi:hypothetical protein